MNGTGSQYNVVTAEENKGQLWVYNVVAFLYNVVQFTFVEKAALRLPQARIFRSGSWNNENDKLTFKYLGFFFLQFFFRLAADSLWIQTYHDRSRRISGYFVSVRGN